LSRSFESGLPRGSPQLTNRSPAVAVAQSPVKSSPHQPPVSRDVAGLKQSEEIASSEELLLLPPALNKSDNEPEELPGSGGDTGRKYSVESKDSDADSAKSSLLDANDTIMRDFGKEDEEEEEKIVHDSTTAVTAIGTGNKVLNSSIEEGLSLVRQQQQQQQTHLIHHGVQQQQAKMDEGYVSAEKVHPADPIMAQSLALFEAEAASKRSREQQQQSAVMTHQQQQEQQLGAATGVMPSVKSPTATISHSSLQSSVLQAQKETTTDMMEISRLQDFTGKKQQQQQQQKAAEEELTQYFNHAVAAAASSAAAGNTAAASMSTWSEQLQQLQQHQQLQQQLQLMDSRSWQQQQASSFGGQIETAKGGKATAAAATSDHQAEKKAAESMLVAASQQQQQQQQQQQTQYQEALLSQMLSYQSEQMNQHQLAYAQQYMKVSVRRIYLDDDKGAAILLSCHKACDCQIL
jgi:hypothetical protein